jgi:hypothetical protein
VSTTTEFPYEELARFDSWGAAERAGHKPENIWSVTEHDGTLCYGPPHHWVNFLHAVVTREAHDFQTYFEEQ